MQTSPVIVVDADIPYVGPVLGPMGTVISVPGHRIGPEDVREADALVVRSVTDVNEDLLGESRVRFVGSATSGIDHVDIDWLRARGIVFADAAGANAESVVEYVLAVIAAGLDASGSSLHDLTLGIVGCGRIGGRLAGRARALGMDVLCNDPPLERSGGARQDLEFTKLDGLLERSDIVSVHVPLERAGTDPTVDLIDSTAIAGMRSGAWLIQTSRGGTVDESAAVIARQDGRLGFLALDVWTDEPVPAADAVATADIATPHIAGYSRDAKLAGLLRIRDALARSLDLLLPCSAPQPHDLPDPSDFMLSMDAESGQTSVFLDVVPRMIDIRADDARMRRSLEGADAPARRFHELRATYPARWAFSRYSVVSVPAGVETEFLTDGIGVGVTTRSSLTPEGVADRS